MSGAPRNWHATAEALRQAQTALLAMRLANENAPTLTQWQRNANTKADAALKAIEAARRAPAGGVPAVAGLSGHRAPEVRP